jgi:hypothetical protein
MNSVENARKWGKAHEKKIRESEYLKRIWGLRVIYWEADWKNDQKTGKSSLKIVHDGFFLGEFEEWNLPNILLGSSSNSVKAYGLYIVLLSREMEGEIEKRIGLDS